MRARRKSPVILSADEVARFSGGSAVIEGAHCADHRLCWIARLGGGEPQDGGYRHDRMGIQIHPGEVPVPYFHVV